MSFISLAWDATGAIDSYSIYRSTSPININNLPVPIATGITGKTYNDATITNGSTYYYRVASLSAGEMKLSAEISIVASVPVVPDPLWSSVEMLVYGDSATYPSTTIVNQSTKRGLTIAGNPTIVSASVKTPYTDNGSVYFDGNTDVITPAGLGFGTQDFTQEAYILLPQTPVYGWYARLFDCYPAMIATVGSDYNAIKLYIDGNPQGASVNIGRETWKHVCLMRKANIFYFFVGGVLISSVSNVGNVNGLSFGGGVTANQMFNGYMNCLRITAGARYAVTGFTPPSNKFPNQ